MIINNESLPGLLILIGISKYYSMPDSHQCINSPCALVLYAMKTARTSTMIPPLRYVQFRCEGEEVSGRQFFCSL